LAADPANKCSNSTTNTAGGGIVSDKDTFSDFENDKYSPHQQRLIKALSISGFVVLLLATVGLLVCYRRRKGKRAAAKTNATVADSNDALDSESTPPDVEE
jgi:hypothetical protein